jgi:hypothetical protein
MSAGSMPSAISAAWTTARTGIVSLECDESGLPPVPFLEDLAKTHLHPVAAAARPRTGLRLAGDLLAPPHRVVSP